MPVHFIIIPLLAIYYSGVLKISRRFVFPLYIRSSSFEDVPSFKSFNSTGATYLLNHFNGVSFEWALTHRSIPRILPDSSYFPEISSNFLSKFDVRMNYHQSNVFLQDLSNSFHRWLNLFVLILPECLNNSWWCFSLSFSTFEDRIRVFLHILSVLSETRGASLLPSSHNCFDREYYFHLSGAIQESS